MCQLDLTDPDFSVPLKKESSKYVSFQWEGTLYEFPCLCFGLGPCSSNLPKFRGSNFHLEKASDLCDNKSGRHVTNVTDTRGVINEQRYNNFSSDSIGICNQFVNFP